MFNENPLAKRALSRSVSSGHFIGTWTSQPRPKNHGARTNSKSLLRLSRLGTLCNPNSTLASKNSDSHCFPSRPKAGAIIGRKADAFSLDLEVLVLESDPSKYLPTPPACLSRLKMPAGCHPIEGTPHSEACNCQPANHHWAECACTRSPSLVSRFRRQKA